MAAGRTSMVRDVSDNLANISLLDSTGELEADSEARILSVPELWRCRCQLQTRLVEYQAKQFTASLDHSHETDKEKLADSIDLLEKELLSVTRDQAQEELLLKRIQLSHTLSECLYPKPKTRNEDPSASEEERKCLETLLLKQADLVTEIMGKHKAITELRRNLLAVKRANFDFLTDNRRLMHKLRSCKEQNVQQTDENHPRIQPLKESLDKCVSGIELTQNVFQSLIVGSGVNWAQDEVLEELVIELGRPVQELIK